MGFKLKSALKTAVMPPLAGLKQSAKLLGFGGNKETPGYDTGAMSRMSEEAAQKQRDLIQQRFTGLEPLNKRYEEGRKALSAQIEPSAEALLGKFRTDLSGVGKMEEDQAAIASQLNRQQQFRDVPEVQKMIRNQLAGNRLMGSGAALSTLAQPTIQAARSASDFDMQRQADLLANKARREEGLATTGFSTRQKAMADRIGMDQDTLDELTRIGRTDLIDKFNALANVESGVGETNLELEQLRQSNEIAQAQAKAAKRGALLGNLGSLAGLGVGALAGGPLGAGLGMQLGGMAGGMMGGQQTQQLDPTLLFALAQRNKGAYNKVNPTADRFNQDYLAQKRTGAFRPAVMP